jgi:putative addiction module component (TIGR02574 family)
VSSTSLMASLGIDRLSPAERAQLVEELLDSLDVEPQPPALTDAQRQELDRRLAALDADRMAVSPWEEVETRILERLKK